MKQGTALNAIATSCVMSHDPLVTRLATMLFKLNQGESINPKDMAQEFNVAVRTIQRDLNERFAYLPFQKSQGCYSLTPEYLGRISAHNIRNFAALAGIQGLFPSLDMAFLRQLYEQETLKSIDVHGHAYEKLDASQQHTFDQLSQAIAQLKTLSYGYTKADQSEKIYHNIHPYRLINDKGIWYLAAVDGGKLKSFALTRIKQLKLEAGNYVFDPIISAELDQEDSVWLGQKISVTLKVTGNAMGYFKRRQLVPKQMIVEESKDYLLVSTQVAHENQILPIVRYWIPDVEILAPIPFQHRHNQLLITAITKTNIMIDKNMIGTDGSYQESLEQAASQQNSESELI